MKQPSEIVSHMGPFIKRRRRRLRLSLQAVADISGCTKSHIWELEKGLTTNPTIGMALAICNALQCSLNSLLGVNVSQPDFTDDEMALIVAHRQIFSP